MTTPAAPAPQDPPAEPTPAQAQQIGTSAAQAATAPGQTPEQREAATQAAVQQRAEELHLTISDEDAAKIAGVTIKMLEQAGAFDQPPAPAQPAGQTSPAPGVEGQAATAAGGDSTSPAAPAPAEPAEPRRRSFAERFQGKS